MQLIYCNPKWEDVPADVWLAAFSKRAKEKLHDNVAGIVDELLEHFPVIVGKPGAMTHEPVPVVLKKGKNIGPHRHPEHLILYYPVGHPAKLKLLDTEFTPLKNSALYLPPNTLHSVQANKNKKPRLSLALRWMPT